MGRLLLLLAALRLGDGSQQQQCACLDNVSGQSSFFLSSSVGRNVTRTSCCGLCASYRGCRFTVFYEDSGDGHCHLQGGAFMYPEPAAKVTTCWSGERPLPPTRFTADEWREDDKNVAVAAAWSRLIVAQERLNGKPPPLQLSWTVANGAPMPIFQKSGQGCLFADNDEVVMAGGIQWVGQFGPYNTTEQPCQDGDRAAPGGCNYALSYNLRTGSWSFLTQPPFYFRRTQGACDASRLYLVGGAGAELKPGSP